jgi:hypothetical protein
MKRTRKYNPSVRPLGGPISGHDLQPPMYYLSEAGHWYVLITEVGNMVEHIARLPVVAAKPPRHDLAAQVKLLGADSLLPRR